MRLTDIITDEDIEAWRDIHAASPDSEDHSKAKAFRDWIIESYPNTLRRELAFAKAHDATKEHMVGVMAAFTLIDQALQLKTKQDN